MRIVGTYTADVFFIAGKVFLTRSQREQAKKKSGK
jgi:hypothetical protein